MHEVESKVQEFTTKMEKYYDSTVKFRWDIEKSFDRHSEEILHQLHLEESRIQDIEIKLVNFIDLNERFNTFEGKYKPLLDFATINAKTPLFVERYLPLMIHL